MYAYVHLCVHVHEYIYLGVHVHMHEYTQRVGAYSRAMRSLVVLSVTAFGVVSVAVLRLRGHANENWDITCGRL